MSRRPVLRHTPCRVVLVGPVVACCACGWLRARLGALRSTLVVGSVAVLAAFFGGYGWQVLWRAYRLRCWLDPGGDSPPAHTYGANAGRGSGSLCSGGADIVAELGYCVGECAARLPVVNDCAALVCEA